MRTGIYDHEILSHYGAQPFAPISPKVSPNCNSYWINNDIRIVVTGRVIEEIAARLLKVDGVRLWQAQAIYKPGTGVHGSSSEAKNGNVS